LVIPDPLLELEEPVQGVVLEDVVIVSYGVGVNLLLAGLDGALRVGPAPPREQRPSLGLGSHLEKPTPGIVRGEQRPGLRGCPVMRDLLKPTSRSLPREVDVDRCRPEVVSDICEAVERVVT